MEADICPSGLADEQAPGYDRERHESQYSAVSPSQANQLGYAHDPYYPQGNTFPPPPGANFSPQVQGGGGVYSPEYAQAGGAPREYGYSPQPPPAGAPPGGFHQPNYGPPPSGAAGAYTPPGVYTPDMPGGHGGHPSYPPPAGARRGDENVSASAAPYAGPGYAPDARSAEEGA